VRIGKLTLRADYEWTDKINYVGVENGFQNGFTSEGVGLLNARLTLALKNEPAEFSIWGKNITNEKYMAYGLDQSSIGITIQQWGPPAEFGVDFTYHFGE
jgi:iron complex outermembrane receptor protein